MKTNLIAWISSIVCIIALDALWLGLTIKRFYAPRIGHLMADSANFAAAGVFYLIYATGLVFFVVSPALRNQSSLAIVFLSGALLGIVAYGTYDWTNQATLKDWPLLLTVVDMVWGGFLTGSAALVATYLTRKFA